MPVFNEHPLRAVLSNEVHARPPVPLSAPEHIAHLAFLNNSISAQQEVEHISALTRQLGFRGPEYGATHYFLDAGRLRLKWNRHTEFSSYTFFRRCESNEEGIDALHGISQAWCERIPGQLIAATRLELVDAQTLPPEALIRRYPLDGTQTVIVTRIAEGGGWVFTDFQIKEGFSHFLIVNASLPPRQAGRMVQRLFEIETYRVLALLALPIAKTVAGRLGQAEEELAAIIGDMSRMTQADDGSALLARLTQVATDVEQSIAKTAYRFGAAEVYYRMIQQRITELRELRVDGFPPVREFMERRLAPAINTCVTLARRQKELSRRIARGSQLLRTRVDIALERQNQALLMQMNRRANLQLHLQQTVEGLSVVAITYYASQLVHYLAKGTKAVLQPMTPEAITALAIPIVAAIAALSIKRLRAHVAKQNIE